MYILLQSILYESNIINYQISNLSFIPTKENNEVTFQKPHE